MPAISLTSSGTAATQNFDTLSNTANSTTNNLTIPGWEMTETGGGARDNEQYAVDTGGSNTGDTFSYGATGATDRALGGLRSGTLAPLFGAQYSNDTGAAITALHIAYTGEEWRLGTAGRTDRLDFQISFNATSLTSGTWVDIDQLDFITPDTVGVGAKNGNLAGEQASLSFDLTSLNIPAGTTFWVRWVDFDASGADDGLAIDNFSITPTTAPPPGNGSFAIADLSVAEGNSGDTPMTFTVTRGGGSAGAVSVDYAISFNSADAADFHAGQSLSGTLAFANGETSKTFTLNVNGDLVVEANETFTVTLSNATGGATIGDATATGTILNDDVAPIPGAFSIADATVNEGNAGTTPITFTVTRGNDSNTAASVHYDVTLPGGATGASASDFSAPVLSGDVAFAANEFSRTITLQIAGDTVNEANETFTVTLSAPTGGATLADGSALGTIVNDDAFVSGGTPFINEFHYDNSGTDSLEAIEIAGPAGTSLAGWKLVLYNGSNTPGAAPVYATINLTGSIPDQDDGYGTLSFNFAGLQNGPQDGFALVDAGGHVVQFLSYEGVITAAPGTPAAGLTSIEVPSEEPADGVGQSLQLTGSGASYDDFTWAPAGAHTFGAVNTGQNFVAGNATGLVSVADAQLAEGNAGTTTLLVTVHRAGGLDQAASVDWTLNLDGTANAADLAAGQPLSGHIDFAVGVSQVQIAVAVAGDTVGEANETFHVTLSNPTGNIAITDANATATILNDDPIALTIMEIQGLGHQSAYVGQDVTTTGIVTQIGPFGYYVQDAAGDGNDATSDAVFVFTGAAPAVAVGDAVQVGGKVAEFSSDPGVGLTVTEIDAPTTNILSHGNALPDAVLIGTGGRLPPSMVIDDDGLTSYDPAHDGLDFYESLEGMRVTIDNPLVIASTNSFGETFVVASDGAGATGVSARGGLTLSAGDFNPERIQIDSLNASPVHYTQGDHVASVTGIVNYSFDHYEVLTDSDPAILQPSTLARETTSLIGDADHLSIASYNVENLDFSDAKYDILAHDIVFNLGAPDIVALQEIQDDNGTGTGVLSADQNLASLCAALNAADPTAHYVYADIDPTAENASGGEPNGNIRNAFVFDINRVSLIAGSLEIITGDAYHNSRNPLVGTFSFNGHDVTVVDVHSYSRGGSDPDFGANQPPVASGDDRRTAMADGVRAYVDDHLATNPNLHFAVMGDWNGFYYETAFQHLTAGGVLTNLNGMLAPEERYSYQFDGNLQQIDNMLVTGGLLGGAQYDLVHINAEFTAGVRPTDHDAQVALFLLPAPNQAPTDLELGNQSVDENQPAGTIVGTLSATDKPTDTLSYVLLDDAGGRFAVDAHSGVVTTTAAFDHEADASFAITAEVTDQGGLSTQQSFTVTVGDVNEAPTVPAIDHQAIDENGAAGTLVGTVGATDPDGNALTYSLVDDAGGLFAIDPVTGALTATASLDYEAGHGYSVTARADDGHGLHTDRVIAIAVNDLNEAPTGLALDHASVDENAAAGTLVGTVSASDPDGNALAFSLVDDAGGRFAIDAAGHLTTTAPLDHEAAASWSVTARADDGHGLTTDRVFTIAVGDVNEAPTGVALDHAGVDENAPAGTLVGTVSASDPDGNALAFSLVDDAGGRFAIDAAGHLTTTTPLDYESGASYSVTARADDGHGLHTDRVFTIAVGDVNEAPTAHGDAASVNEDATTGNLWTSLLANDSDPDAGTHLTIASVDTTGTLGHVLFDAGTQSVRYVADADAFDALPTGTTATDHFTYTVTDGHGLTSTATVTVTVTAIADGITVNAGNGDDLVNGTGGEDSLSGGNGNDAVYGLDGHDSLSGGNGNDSLYGGAGSDVLHGDNGNDLLDGGTGNDVLDGGNGNDTLTGGAGADKFVFGKGGGNDIVTDFDTGLDRLFLADGAQVKSFKVEDVNHDGIQDLNIAFSNGGGSVVLLGVSDFGAVHFGQDPTPLGGIPLV
jgi:VCBS repeat-containing protein